MTSTLPQFHDLQALRRAFGWAGLGPHRVSWPGLRGTAELSLDQKGRATIFVVSSKNRTQYFEPARAYAARWGWSINGNRPAQLRAWRLLLAYDLGLLPLQSRFCTPSVAIFPYSEQARKLTVRILETLAVLLENQKDPVPVAVPLVLSWTRCAIRHRFNCNIATAEVRIWRVLQKLVEAGVVDKIGKTGPSRVRPRYLLQHANHGGLTLSEFAAEIGVKIKAH